MLKCFKDAFIGTAALLLPLHVWRWLYPVTDWAALPLVLLAIGLFLGIAPLSAAMFRAILRSAVRSQSPLSHILTGRIRAVMGATFFVLVAVPLLAWQALDSSHLEACILTTLCLLAGIAFSVTQARLASHLHRPFSRTIPISLSTWCVALPFVLAMTWVNLEHVSYPGEMRTASLAEAVMLEMEALPQRRGMIAELLAPFYALNAVKLWLVIQTATSKWPIVLFCLDAVFVSFFLARARTRDRSCE